MKRMKLSKFKKSKVYNIKRDVISSLGYSSFRKLPNTDFNFTLTHE